jgi:protein-tyrosine phosphatase
MKQILVVCTANVCRSPLVASLLQQKIIQSGLAGAVMVESAGVRAVAGDEVDPVIVTMLDKVGVELAAKYATPVAERALREADLGFGHGGGASTVALLSFAQCIAQSLLVE